MPTKCVNQLPSARVRVHSPSLGWRPHRDRTFTAKGETDLDLFAGIIIETLQALGYGALQDADGNQPFVVGFLLDTMNRLPPPVRKVLAVGIMQGWGMVVEPDEDNKGITVRNVPRYTPLVGDETTESGLIIPKEGSGPGGLVLPGQD